LLGTADSTDPVQGETKERIGGNQGGVFVRPGER
jgi:hypothetical protein